MGKRYKRSQIKSQAIKIINTIKDKVGKKKCNLRKDGKNSFDFLGVRQIRKQNQIVQNQGSLRKQIKKDDNTNSLR